MTSESDKTPKLKTINEQREWIANQVEKQRQRADQYIHKQKQKQRHSEYRKALAKLKWSIRREQK